MIVFAEVFEAQDGIVLCMIRITGATGKAGVWAPAGRAGGIIGLVRFQADVRKLPFDPRRCAVYLSHDTLLQGAA